MTAASLRDVDSDLVDTLRELFPEAPLATGRAPQDGVTLRFIPGIRNTHMLVPAGDPGAAARSVDRPSAKDSRRQRLKRHAVGSLLGSRKLAPLVFPHTLSISTLR